jgi:cytidylate kinase
MKVIAIDGPAASGKSSVAKRLALRLQCSYVNSGSMYRAVTWELLREGIDPARVDAVEATIARMDLGCGFSDDGESYIRVNSRIPDAELRESEVNNNVSAVSAIPAVRHLIVSRLRSLANERDVVMEGRDIGTAVFPETPYKFYLDASPEIRRQRRAAEGQTDSIEKRDKLDSTRKEAPLKIAKDACVVDTSHMSLEDVVEKVFGIIQSATPSR